MMAEAFALISAGNRDFFLMGLRDLLQLIQEAENWSLPDWQAGLTDALEILDVKDMSVGVGGHLALLLARAFRQFSPELPRRTRRQLRQMFALFSVIVSVPPNAEWVGFAAEILEILGMSLLCDREDPGY
jgi:hypothetical protein